MSERIALLLLAFFACCFVAFPQSRDTHFNTLSISEWVGQRFIFLPRPKKLQSYGYQGIHKPKNQYDSLPYDKYVGRTAKVTKVAPSSVRVSGAWTVELVMEDTGEKIVAEASLSKVEGIAPVADVESARETYVGKTLWFKQSILHAYNQQAAQQEYLTLAVTPSRVKIAEVVVGEDENHPVRLVVETEAGEKGYVDLSVSGTNASDELRSFNTFDKFFLTENPYKDSPSIPSKLTPIGGVKISTKYDRFTDSTTAILEEQLVAGSDSLVGLHLTVVGEYSGTQVTVTPKFFLYLSWLDAGSSTRPLRLMEAKTLFILADTGRLQLSVTDYKFDRNKMASWVREEGRIEFTLGDLNELLKAKTADGRWGDVEFKFRGEALEALRQFVRTLQPTK